MRLLGWMPDLSAGTERPAGRPAPAPALRDACAARRSGADRGAAAAWLDPVLAWNRARGAAPASLERARALLGAGGCAVVTGQQPALGGGPLYSLYKLLTAVELAARVEREEGRPAQAVFWLVGDDSDFGEVAGCCWPRPDLAVARLRDDAIPGAGSLIGRLDARRQTLLFDDPALWTAGDTALRTRIEQALARGGDWSGAFAALIFELWPALPVLFVDGAHPAILEAQSEWLAAAASWPLAELLTEGAEEARAAGYEPALDPALGERAVYVIEADRRGIWAGASAERTGPLSPNVVLRPLVQDLLLPNVATVGGPSELRYRAQLGPLYRHAEIPAPALHPRLRAVLLPPRREAPAGEDLAADDWRAVRDPDQWLTRRAAAEFPAALQAALAGARDRFDREVAALAEPLAAFDASLPQLLESARGKIDFQLQRVDEGVAAKARQRLYRREPALARWREFVRPRDGEQERSLSLLTPFLFEGGAPPEALRAAAREAVDPASGRLDETAVFVLDEMSGEEP